MVNNEIKDDLSVPEEFGISATLEMNAVSGAVKPGMKMIGSTNDMFMVDPTKLRVWPGFNTRIKDEKYWEKVELLAESIRQNGFYKDKPLACYVVKEGEETVVYVVEGGRRLDASLRRMQWMTEDEAKEFRIPAVAKDRETSEVDLVYGLAQGNNSEPFRPYELAVLCKRLKQVYSQTEEQILTKMKGLVSETHLPNLLIVAGAPRQIAELVIAEKVSVTVAAQAMNKYGNKAIEMLLKAAANAKADGKDKITPRFMPGQRLKTALTKEAGSLYASAKQVMEDEGFAGLSEQTRAVLEDLMRQLKGYEDVEVTGDTPDALVQSNDDGVEAELAQSA